MKRATDLLVAFLSLPILLILYLVFGTLIKLEDGGTIFYQAQRRGKYGRPFNMYKFRTMQMEAPDWRNPDGSTKNAANDPRLTRIGRLLRKTSLDEIPQLLNVLKGEMSLVGPRPNLVGKPLKDMTALEKKRLQMKPGITGYSQAYYRNSITTEQKYQHDCYYIDHYSYRLDIQILLQSFRSVLKQKNIYQGEKNA